MWKRAEPPVKILSGRYSLLSAGKEKAASASPVARAWAIAKLRGSGEPVTEQNIERMLASRSNSPESSAGVAPVSKPVEKREETPLEKTVENLSEKTAPQPEAVQAGQEVVKSDPPKPTGLSPEAVLDLHRELREHRQALEESRRREVSLRKLFDELSERVRDTDSFEQEIGNLTDQLEHSRQKIQELSGRLDEARVEEMLRNAEENHLQEQQALLRKAEEKERNLLTLVSKLEAEVAQLHQQLEEANSRLVDVDSQKENQELSEILERATAREEELVETLNARQQEVETLSARVRELESSLSASVQAASSSEVENLHRELENARAQIAELTGFDEQPDLERRRILVETLESEVGKWNARSTQITERLSHLRQNPEGIPADRVEREVRMLDGMSESISKRVDALKGIIHESLVFLRRRAAEETSDDQNSDN